MANSDMKEALELERKIYKEIKAREDASRQREADETADMFNESKLARLQDENRRLRAFVEEEVADGKLDMHDAIHNINYTIWLYQTELGAKAAALLASMKPAEGSDATK